MVTFSANLSDKIIQTHVELLEIPNHQFYLFSKNRAQNSCYSKLMTFTSLKEIT